MHRFSTNEHSFRIKQLKTKRKMKIVSSLDGIYNRFFLYKNRATDINLYLAEWRWAVERNDNGTDTRSLITNEYI